MQIVIMAIGTRGDVQPVIALGQALQAAGFKIRVIVGSNFVEWIESYGFEVYPTVDMEALMQSELGVQWVESKSQLEQMRAMRVLTHSIIDTALTDVIQGSQGADLLIGGFISEPYAQAIAEKSGIPVVTVALQPYRATRSGSATILPLLPRSNSLLNFWMGRFSERIIWSIWKHGVDKMRVMLKLPPHTAHSYIQSSRKIPALYAFSKHIVPPVEDTNAYTTGYWFLDEDFTPPGDLVNFIEAGEPPVYVGFGSMSSSDPTSTIQIAADALARNGQRGVLARGWSGLVVQDVPKHIFLLDKVSHTWLFPRMAAVVHHGGAGTTAAGLRAGKPTLIVPHMSDQPFWGRRVFELGVGVKPIPRQKLTTDTLAASLKTLLTDQNIKTNAADLGERIRAEDGIGSAVKWIKQLMG